MNNDHADTTPRAVAQESRISFSILWYATESEAIIVGQRMRDFRLQHGLPVTEPHIGRAEWFDREGMYAVMFR